MQEKDEKLDEIYKENMDDLIVFKISPDLTNINKEMTEIKKENEALKQEMDRIRMELLEVKMKQVQELQRTELEKITSITNNRFVWDKRRQCFVNILDMNEAYPEVIFEALHKRKLELQLLLQEIYIPN